ncbi:HpcH/HpaI aldolase/citrate lyase family protein [Nakamurella aerolata]|uniref:HpcH/HpaI aldolase/citrate lyase family protein n=1 Tax=Nakamurella aerolata TaxID=1656892 RepID=UPI001BB1B6FB
MTGEVSKRPALTYLYVPADRPDRVRKALASAADVVLIDLEDAVAPAHKAAARRALPELLDRVDRPSQVRVNAADTAWGAADLALVAELPTVVGVRIPKCANPAVVSAQIAGAGDRPAHLLLESALGVERAFELAQLPGVASLGLGEADLRADLGVTDDAGLDWARSRLVNACAAAGLPAPIMSVYTQLRDLAGLADSCRRGRARGFLGRAALHPAQLPVIRDAFIPSAGEISAARQLLAAGNGANALPDGRFVDEAVLRQARRTLALAGAPAAPPDPG